MSLTQEIIVSDDNKKVTVVLEGRLDALAYSLLDVSLEELFITHPELTFAVIDATEIEFASPEALKALSHFWQRMVYRKPVNIKENVEVLMSECIEEVFEVAGFNGPNGIFSSWVIFTAQQK